MTLKGTILAFSLTIAAVALPPVPAEAQGRVFCGDREKIIGDLARKYGETRRSYGLARNKGVVEVYASESGSWTILIARPGGTACLIAAGEAFEAEEPAPLEESL
ncbi:MAG: hypothetical protein AAFR84_01265 [Pseudomonadota bacterium]